MRKMPYLCYKLSYGTNEWKRKQVEETKDFVVICIKVTMSVFLKWPFICNACVYLCSRSPPVVLTVLTRRLEDETQRF